MKNKTILIVCIIFASCASNCSPIRRLDDAKGDISLLLEFYFQDGDYRYFYRVEEKELYLGRTNRINAEIEESDSPPIVLTTKTIRRMKLQGAKLMHVNEQYIDSGALDGINWKMTIIMKGAIKTITISNYYLPEMDSMINIINSAIPKDEMKIPLTVITEASN